MDEGVEISPFEEEEKLKSPLRHLMGDFPLPAPRVRWCVIGL